MIENGLVYVNDEAWELDCVLETELEDAVDPVLPVEDSVLCCALTHKKIKQCSHITERRISGWGEKRG